MIKYFIVSKFTCIQLLYLHIFFIWFSSFHEIACICNYALTSRISFFSFFLFHFTLYLFFFIFFTLIASSGFAFCRAHSLLFCLFHAYFCCFCCIRRLQRSKPQANRTRFVLTHTHTHTVSPVCWQSSHYSTTWPATYCCFVTI